jgi:hypothetical protein
MDRKGGRIFGNWIAEAVQKHIIIATPVHLDEWDQGSSSFVV